MGIDYDKLRRILKEYRDYSKDTVLEDNVNLEDAISQDNSEDIILGNKSNIFERSLKSEMGSASEIEAKKIMVLSSIAANDSRSEEEIVSIVDEGIVNAKVAYKVGNGEMDVAEAIEIMIDRAAVRTDVFLQDMLKNMEKVAEIAVLIGPIVYPPITAYLPIIETVLKVAEPAVKKCVTMGLKTVATVSKTLIRKVADKVKTVSEIIKKIAKNTPKLQNI